MRIIPLITFSAVALKAVPIIIAILFFGLIIMLHEGGHFLVAKLFDVKINEFSMGMGPCLLKRKKGETQYSLRAFPVGGFVSMEGEDSTSDEPRAFCNKPAWQRFLIVCAGAVVNIIMGFLTVLIMLSFTTGEDSGIGTTEILYFTENATTCNDGLQEGDIITNVNGKRVFSIYDLGVLMMGDSDGVFDIGVRRAGEKITVPGVAFKTEDVSGHSVVRLDFMLRGVDPTPKNVLKYAPIQTVSLARMVYISLFQLVTGHYGLNDLSGPIGTVAYVAESAQTESGGIDFESMLLVMALVAVNVGVFNLLPLPALDGGRLFFILIEMIFRKPVPARYEKWVHAAGLVLLLGLMVVISASDILKLIRGEL
ncbi:MAG: site-2 protease family protein [Clostridia bacterium]|nr:site-2 protease family protein [Clostridia bacterium]MBR0120627.1 site-2 protease family protein [Clostridia bacterium]